MNPKETLLQIRDSLIQKRADIDRDIHHTDSLLFSLHGWTPSPDSATNPQLPAIAYNKEARDYIEEIYLIWDDTQDVTSLGFIEWLKKKFPAEAVRENSARGAIVAMEKEGVLKVKTEGRGRIGSTYTIAPR